MPSTDTTHQFDTIIHQCRTLFKNKLQDYGASWRILRPSSVTDQILIKAKRIRSLEEKKISKVNEGIEPEFVAIINYGIIALIQLEQGYTDQADMDSAQALTLYDKHMQETKELMLAKNHDYDEAWRIMRIESYTDLILTKLFRIKQIEKHHGKTIVSEGEGANYQDIINYALFALIRLQFDKE